MTWIPTDPNMLPVDHTTGGLARFIGWIDNTSAVVTTPGNGTLSLDRDTWITTVAVGGGVAVAKIPVSPGRTYTAAVTSDGFVGVTLMWVMDDGTVLYGGTGTGAGRVSVTALAPTHAAGVVVEYSAPTVRITTTGSLEYTISYLDRTQVAPYQISADPTGGSGPITLTSPVLVGFPSDPGPLDPTVLDDTLGTRLYLSLPGFMRKDDTQHLLKRYLSGVGVIDDQMRDVALQVAAGELTDPDNAPDVWIPWLATVSGVPVSDVPSTRALLQAQALAPAVGTRAALAALARQFLTGTKVADVFPSTTSWTIDVRVRNDELSLVTDEAGLAAAMMATGQVPAGYVLNVKSGLPTWAQIDAAMTTWGDSDGYADWAHVDSIGVTGL